MEPIENIKTIHYTIAEQRKNETQEKLKDVPINNLIGKFVKKEFLSLDNRFEHMWVKIDRILENGNLSGLLANDPICLFDIKNGDRVEVNIFDIEQIS